MKEYTINLEGITSWQNIFMQFEEYDGYDFKKYDLPELIELLRKNASEDMLILIKNPQIGFGMHENKFRTILLEILTVINTELYAVGKSPTIKVAFTK